MVEEYHRLLSDNKIWSTAVQIEMAENWYRQEQEIKEQEKKKIFEEKQRNNAVAQKNAIDAKKIASDAKKIASDAKKIASDAQKIAEEKKQVEQTKQEIYKLVKQFIVKTYNNVDTSWVNECSMSQLTKAQLLILDNLSYDEFKKNVLL